MLAKRTLDHVGRTVGSALHEIDPRSRFDVSLRLYHGWYKGFEKTDSRRVLVTVVAGADFPALSTKATVAIRSEIAYGDRLLSALDIRLHSRLGIHLPNTHRERSKGEYEEKMVDTAMAADVVDLAHREHDRWIMIIGDDDDLVPPLYTAEAVSNARPRRICLVSTRGRGPFLKLEGILIRR